MENLTNVKKVELGYTLTYCDPLNATFGCDQQKQYVVKIDEKLFNIFLKGYLIEPSDVGRNISYHKLADLSIEDFEKLKNISESHQEINWNTGKYDVHTNLLSPKQYSELKKATSSYIKELIRICEPTNTRVRLKTVKELKKILKPFLSNEEYYYVSKHLIIW